MTTAWRTTFSCHNRAVASAIPSDDPKPRHHVRRASARIRPAGSTTSAEAIAASRLARVHSAVIGSDPMTPPIASRPARAASADFVDASDSSPLSISTTNEAQFASGEVRCAVSATTTAPVAAACRAIASVSGVVPDCDTETTRSVDEIPYPSRSPSAASEDWRTISSRPPSAASRRRHDGPAARLTASEPPIPTRTTRAASVQSARNAGAIASTFASVPRTARGPSAISRPIASGDSVMM